MTRFYCEEILLYDLEIEKIAKSLRKQMRLRRKKHNQHTILQVNNSVTKYEGGEEQMAEECTLRELATPPLHKGNPFTSLVKTWKQRLS